MTEIRSQVLTWVTDMVCNTCGKGNMRPTGIVLTSMPPKYPHVCDKCGYQEAYNNQFPYTECEII